MNKLLSILILSACACTASIAADKPGEQCTASGAFSQVGKDVMSCTDGKWTLRGTVGETPLKVSLQMYEGSKVLHMLNMSTVDGGPTSAMVGNKHSYIAAVEKNGNTRALVPGSVDSGVSAQIYPTLDADGRIDLEFSVSITDVAFDELSHDGDVIQLPQVRSISMRQTVKLDSSSEVDVPFGPKVSGKNQYTLKLVASKG